jgi:NTP pyrophosphatase (non-canonical NTP hydrolase)
VTGIPGAAWLVTDGVTVVGFDPSPTLQDRITAWRREKFPQATDVRDMVLVLCEEAGEAARATAKRSIGIRGSTEEWTVELRQEIADVVIAAYGVAMIEGFDLDAAVEERFAYVRDRTLNRDRRRTGDSGMTIKGIVRGTIKRAATGAAWHGRPAAAVWRLRTVRTGPAR